MNHNNEAQILEAASLPEEGVQPLRRPSYLLHASLLIATIFTTLLAGAILSLSEGFYYEQILRALKIIMANPETLWRGVPFSFTLMIILLTHEMGHYLTARHYGVSATLPYFIPAPPFPFIIGTFGAFIRMQSPILRKRAILEIGAAGPIAGFVVAIVAVYIGLGLSTPVSELPEDGILLGVPLAFSLLGELTLTVPEGGGIAFHPIAFAGWIGLLVTALNLMPIGQLDGGHVVYALFGKKHRWISIGMIVILFILGTLSWLGWYVWAVLTALLGVRHPPMVDPEISLLPRQKIIGWSSLVIFVLCFTPAPFMIA